MTPSSKATERPHIDYVDGLRAVCALWVVMGRGGGEVDALPEAQLIFFSFLSYAHFGVTTFIVISGFCLAIPVARNRGSLKSGALVFLLKRARRILPPYYLAMILSLGLVWTVIGTPGNTHWDVSLPVTFHTIVAHLLLVHNFFSASRINHAFWSIAVEWQIYFFFPSIVYAFLRWGAGRTLAALFVITTLVEIYVVVKTTLWAVPVHYLWLFALGMFAAEIGFGDGPQSFWREFSFWVSVSFGGLLLVLLSCTDIYSVREALFPLDLLAGVTAAATLAAMATGAHVSLRRFLETQFLVWIGIFAYSIYLIHAPLLAVGGRYLIKPLGLSPAFQMTVMILIVEPLAVVLAYLFFLICERPFMTPALKRHVIEFQDMRPS